MIQLLQSVKPQKNRNYLHAHQLGICELETPLRSSQEGLKCTLWKELCDTLLNKNSNLPELPNVSFFL
jgi:hypothetical protein